jgi:transcriptional regulator with XRE-family HTH domain
MGKVFTDFFPHNSQEKIMNLKLQIASMLVAHRCANKKTQTQVAKMLNVTFQQVQKYEHMINKITSEKLLQFCISLNVRLQSFQDGDPYQVLEGAEISIIEKEKAMQRIEKLTYDADLKPLLLTKEMEITNDQSSSR